MFKPTEITGTKNNGPYSYRDVLAASQKTNWRTEDIIGADNPLDFSKPFSQQRGGALNRLPRPFVK